MDPYKAGQQAADKALDGLLSNGWTHPQVLNPASTDVPKINDTGVRICYECLIEGDGHPDYCPSEVVAQGLCRRHLAYEYANEMFEDTHTDWDEDDDDE